MVELIPTLLGAAAAVLFVYAMFVRKNWLETKALLADTTIRYEALIQHGKQAEGQRSAQKEQLEKLRQQTLKAEKTLEEQKRRFENERLDAAKAKDEQVKIVQKLNALNEHFAEQVQVLTVQLADAVKEKKAALDELAAFQRNFEERVRTATDAQRRELSELQNQIQAARRDRSAAQTQLEKFKQESGHVKPEELRRWQLKVARLEQLYASMKGLREMAEERNQNWETALRYFATHILGDKTKAADTSIGSLVGAALEKIGATLVIDEEEAVPHATLDTPAIDSPEMHS